jgi:hypothetical protein
LSVLPISSSKTVLSPHIRMKRRVRPWLHDPPGASVTYQLKNKKYT